MKKAKAVVGIIGCLLLCFFGTYRFLSESLNSGPLILSFIFTIGSPIAAIAIAVDYRKQSNNG